MIEIEVSKRSTSFGFMVLGVAMMIAPIVLIDAMGPFSEGSVGSYSALASLFTGLGLKFFFWFKALYHWGLAKGYSGALAVLGILGFPIAPLIFALLQDKVPAPPSPDDPWLSCPNCDVKYRLGDYRKDAEQIYCSSCNCELPLPRQS